VDEQRVGVVGQGPVMDDDPGTAAVEGLDQPPVLVQRRGQVRLAV